MPIIPMTACDYRFENKSAGRRRELVSWVCLLACKSELDVHVRFSHPSSALPAHA